MPWKLPEARRAYSRAYYLAHREELIAKAMARAVVNPEQHRASNKRWYENHGRAYRGTRRDELNAYQRAYDAAHPEQVRTANRTQRLRRYGLTINTYETMADSQDGKCAICRKPETHRGRNGEITLLAVDHDHATGSIRALLCHSCNTGVGSFLDNPQLLIAAADYIRRFRG